MAVARRTQNNAMLYTVITFVALFLVAATVAVIYYLKYEDKAKEAERAETQFRELATDLQWAERVRKIGARKAQETYLGKMLKLHDQTVAVILGGPLAELSAEDTVDTMNNRVSETLRSLTEGKAPLEDTDPNTLSSLLRVIARLKAQLESAAESANDWKQRYAQLRADFDNAQQEDFRKEQEMQTQMEKFRQQLASAEQKYRDSENLLSQTMEERAKTLMAQRDETLSQLRTTNTDLLKTRAELKLTLEKLDLAHQQLTKTMPAPDMEAAAFKPDGRIILVDQQTVHINIGSDDRVYPGLTFAVYDKSAPVPKEGKGKAEVEVFDVHKNFSTARITYSEIRSPIVRDDVVANLIWDRDKKNVFVIAGEFDLNGDGQADYDASVRLGKLIEKWGGQVGNDISVNTDFVLLGKAPQVPKQPTTEEMDVDPLAMRKYQAAFQANTHYSQLISQAKALWIPVFNIERFLYFIGYKTLSNRPDAFYSL